MRIFPLGLDIGSHINAQGSAAGAKPPPTFDGGDRATTRRWPPSAATSGEVRNIPLFEAKLSSNEFAERLFHIGMARNRGFFAGPGIRVNVVLLAMSLQITAGLDKLTDKFTSPYTSNLISLV